MIRANTTIIVGSKTYTAGQPVNGLSKLDRKWMKDAGYITDVPAEQKNKEEGSVNGGKADGL